MLERDGNGLLSARTSVCFSSEMYPRMLFLAIALMIRQSISSCSNAPKEEQRSSGKGEACWIGRHGTVDAKDSLD